MHHASVALALVAAALLLAAPAAAADVRPLSQLLAGLEADGGVVTEAELEHGQWEVRVCTGAGCEERVVSPATGEVLRRKPKKAQERPPPGARPASAVAKALEASGAGRLTKLEFEHGEWTATLRVDPR